MVRIFMIVLLLTLLLGCSRIKIAYNQLDWLLPYYLETYMELSKDQSSYLEQEVKEMLAWHCAMHLSNYATLFREANADFQRDQMTHERLEYFSSKIETFWFDLMQQASPVIAQLLLTANDEQIAELFNSINKKNRKWLTEYKKQSEAELNADYLEHMTEELVRWFGPLHKAQLQAVKAWVKQFKPLGIEGFEMRRKWQFRLRELTLQRNNVAAFKTGVTKLLLHPDFLHTPGYQKRLDDNRKVTKELIYFVAKQLSKSQRTHLAGETYAIARDFDDLACKQVSTL